MRRLQSGTFTLVSALLGSIILGSCISSNQTAAPERAPASIQVFEGVVDRMDDGGFYFRTATQDLYLKRAQFDTQMQSKLKEEIGLNRRMKLPLNPDQFNVVAEIPYGIRPNCSELPISYNEFLDVARDPDVKSTLDFFNKLPKGVLQTFTLIYKSNSVQKEGVDSNWPRVLRQSADGKMIFSYTCEPNSPTYNSIEMIRFDDKENGYKFTSIDFKGKGATEVGSRVVENPMSCHGCHSPTKYQYSDPRPVWQMYSFWDGVYGSTDDRLLNDELKNFKAFKETQANNPCYQLLPWPDKSKGQTYPNYDLYPYSTVNKTSDYHLRPNLKLTEVHSHLLAKRLARKFMAVPRFKKLKFLVLMDALGCNVPDIDKKIQAQFSKYKAPQPVTAIPPDHLKIFTENYRKQGVTVNESQVGQFLIHFDPRSQQSGGTRLYAIGEALNFKFSDWTMTNSDFMPPDTPLYNTGISSTRNAIQDIPVVRGTLGEIFRMVSEQYPELKNFLVLTRGESKNFGEKFSCVDDLGGELNLTDRNQQGIACKILQEKANFEDSQPRGKNPSIAETILKNRRKDVVQKSNPELVSKGRRMALETCFTCHSEKGGMSKSYHFFKSEEFARENFRTNRGFLNIVYSRIDAEVGEMPPFSNLPAEDRLALKSYFHSLTRDY